MLVKCFVSQWAASSVIIYHSNCIILRCTSDSQHGVCFSSHVLQCLLPLRECGKLRLQQKVMKNKPLGTCSAWWVRTWYGWLLLAVSKIISDGPVKLKLQNVRCQSRGQCVSQKMPISDIGSMRTYHTTFYNAKLDQNDTWNNLRERSRESNFHNQ